MGARLTQLVAGSYHRPLMRCRRGCVDLGFLIQAAEMKLFRILSRAMPIAVVALVSFSLGMLARSSSRETGEPVAAVALAEPTLAATAGAPAGAAPAPKKAAAGNSIKNLTEHFN